MTLQIKLILAALGLLAIAYSYLWTYHQGQLTGQAKEVQIQLLKQEEQRKAFQDQRQQEIKDARREFERLLKQEQLKVKAKEDANNILNEEKDAVVAMLNSPVPDGLIELYNSRVRNFGQPNTGDSKPTSRSNEKVLPAV